MLEKQQHTPVGNKCVATLFLSFSLRRGADSTNYYAIPFLLLLGELFHGCKFAVSCLLYKRPQVFQVDGRMITLVVTELHSHISTDLKCQEK